MAGGAARRAALPGDGHARPLGDSRRRDRARRRRRGCRWSSACTDPTSTSPRRSRPRRVAARLRVPSAPASSPPAATTSAAARSRSAPTPASHRSRCPTASMPGASGREPERRAAMRRELRSASRRRAAGVRGRTAGAQEGIRVPDRRLGARRDVPACGAGDRRRRRPARRAARARRARAGVADRVRFLGNLSQDDVGAHLAAADVVGRAVGPGRQRQRRRAAERRPRGAGVGARRSSRPPPAASARWSITSGPGWSCRSGDPAAIAAAVQRLAGDPSRCGAASATPPGAWSRPDSAGATSPSASRRRIAAALAHHRLAGDNISGSPMTSSAARGSLGSACSSPHTTTAGRSPAWSSRALQTARDADARTTRSSSSTTAAPTRPPRSLDELARTYPQVRVVHHPQNRGYGGALRSGFAAATRELVFYTDGDAQYDPAEMTVLWQRVRSTVSTWSTATRSAAPTRCTGSSSGGSTTTPSRLLFGLKVRDVDCDFRLMRRSIFERVQLEKNSGVICLEMMKKIQDAGFRIAEVPGASLPSRATASRSSSTSAGCSRPASTC